jgi:hypothetical protein
MDTADAFGSLFDDIPPSESAQPRTAAWGEDTSYEYEGYGHLSGPNTPHPGLGHTMNEDFATTHPFVPAVPMAATIDDNPDAALPVTYGEDEMAQQIAAALAAPEGTVTHVAPAPRPVTATNVTCPKCQSTFAPGQDIEMVAGVGLQHKACPGQQATARVQSVEERGKYLLAYADAIARGETPAGPNPFEHVAGGGQVDNEIAHAAQQALAKSRPLQTEALKTYNPQERQAIIDEGVTVRAGNLDRLDISGTHYEALVQAGREDEDLTFLDGDPNLPDAF